MKPFDRSERVGALMQRVISETLRKDVKDPRLAAATITGVSLSRDLRNAKVFFTIPGGKEAAEEADKGFSKAVGFIKRVIGREMDLRYIPKIHFCYDASFDYGSRIDTVLNSLKTDGRTDHPGPESE